MCGRAKVLLSQEVSTPPNPTWEYLGYKTILLKLGFGGSQVFCGNCGPSEVSLSLSHSGHAAQILPCPN